MTGFYPMFGGLRGYSGSMEATRAAARGKSRAEAAHRALHDLEERLDKLSLICMSMWSLILERTDLTEEDLVNRVEEIDTMDGVPDGRVTKQIQKCTKCGRTMSPKHNRCLYCGAGELKNSAFDEIT